MLLLQAERNKFDNSVKGKGNGVGKSLSGMRIPANVESVAPDLLQEDTESHEVTQKTTVELNPRNMPKRTLIEDNFEETDEKMTWRKNQAEDTEKKQPQIDMFR